MTTLVIVICVIAFLVWLGRLIRRRELQKFRDVDAQVLSELRQQHPVDNEGPALDLMPTADDVHLLRSASTPEISRTPSREVNKPNVVLKPQVLGERERKIIAVVESLLASEYRVLPNVAIQQMLHDVSEGRVTFVIVNASYEPQVVLEFFDQGFTESLSLLKQIDFPIIRLEGNESEPAMRLKLKSQAAQVLNSTSARRRCPKCHKSMRLRSPGSGKNAGKRFWLCEAYPECKGVVSA